MSRGFFPYSHFTDMVRLSCSVSTHSFLLTIIVYQKFLNLSTLFSLVIFLTMARPRTYVRLLRKKKGCYHPPFCSTFAVAFAWSYQYVISTLPKSPSFALRKSSATSREKKYCGLWFSYVTR